MTLAIEAVFENGVLKPLNPLALEEHQTVRLIVETDATIEVAQAPSWHWRESQAIEDGFSGAVTDEVDRQRREG
jgi:predicted DNA-binding antitoxin AbrB/MazE fold protein